MRELSIGRSPDRSFLIKRFVENGLTGYPFKTGKNPVFKPSGTENIAFRGPKGDVCVAKRANMKKLRLFLPLLILSACKITTPRTGGAFTARIEQEGLLDCFESGLSNADGSPVTCEGSAVLFDGQSVLVASDKDIPGERSSVLVWRLVDGRPDTLRRGGALINPVLKKATKFEEFARTPDNRHVLLTTGFDRVKPGSMAWDNYNALIYWPMGEAAKARMYGGETSVGLREKFSKVLAGPTFPDGVPYFKTEGLTATKDRLYWGIREEGKKYDDFAHKIKVVSVGYAFLRDSLVLSNDWSVVADIHVSEPGLPEPLALSSIEYDPYRNRFWLLTSYEKGTDLAAFLWTATPEELKAGTMQPVRDNSGLILKFRHKAEDMTFTDSRHLLVIHDEDRVQIPVNGKVRQLNQTPYSIVEIR